VCVLGGAQAEAALHNSCLAVNPLIIEADESISALHVWSIKGPQD
jgi:hypothetical protein